VFRGPLTILSSVLFAACGGDGAVVGRVIQQWSFSAPAATAPPGVGPERRVIVVLKDAAPGAGGKLVTLEQANGMVLESPPDGAPLSEHAPLFASGKIFVMSKIGKLSALDLAGTTHFTVPDGDPLGPTGPLVAGPDGIVRVGTTSGFVLGFDPNDGSEKFRVEAGGAVSTAIGVAADGTAYAATDIGRVIGVSAAGLVVFDETVEAPASGPSVAPNGDVVVGEGTGVRIFSSDGNEKAKHPRAARVVGTRVLESGEILAWGEDGKLELLSAEGEARWSYSTAASSPPPIYARPRPVEEGAFGLIDSKGVAHLVDANGKALATLALDGEPSREVADSELNALFVSIGSTVRGVGFSIEAE
jgi:outer membrane protein assembly factor BamB